MKAWNLVFISVGLLLVLHMFGYPVGVATTLFDTIGISFDEDPTSGPEIANVTTSAGGFYSELFQDTDSTKGLLVAIGSAIAGIVAGLFTRAKPENLVLLPLITTTLVLFISAYVTIMQYVISQGQVWITAIITFIFLPITVGFIMALAEFFRGTD